MSTAGIAAAGAARALVIADIAETVGAPSPTVVVFVGELPGADDGASLLRALVPGVRRTGIAFTKWLFIETTEAGEDCRCRFLQLRAWDGDEVAGSEAERDCINSMVAACHATLRRASRAGRPRGAVVVRNVETGLRVAAVRGPGRADLDIEIRPPRPVFPARCVIDVPGAAASALVLKVNNPYLLVDAGALGISRARLLAVRGAPPPTLAARLHAEAARVRAHLGLPPDSDLPKVALVRRDESGLVARTIYLGRWHPGVPLTGVTSFVVATRVPGSPWHEPASTGTGLDVWSPRGRVHAGVQVDPSSGGLTAFTIANRKVILHVDGLRL